MELAYADPYLGREVPGAHAEEAGVDAGRSAKPERAIAMASPWLVLSA
ncbi:MAG: hypothetical protein M3448_00455 [Pseudomonadota bacterium]|nr:hypothetical protein [Pseudomonadota bacterium]